MSEVVVVGGGIIGLAVAEELVRRGVGVTVLERNPQAGAEASGAAAGILTPQGDVPGPGPLLDLLVEAYTLVPEAVRRVESASGVETGYRESGLLSVALSEPDEEELARQAGWQEEAGIRVQRVEPDEIRRIEPAVDGAVRRGVWCEQGCQVDPPRLTEAYRVASEKQGARILLQTEVRRFVTERNRVLGVEAATGERFYADWTVNCSGCWAGLDPGLPVPIPGRASRGQMLQFQTAKPLVQRMVKSPRAYLVQRSPERLIAGSTVEYVGFDKRVTEPGCSAIRDGAQALSSRVQGLPLETAWAGLRPDTPDHLPIVGPTPLDQFLVAAGHFRNGILLAPWTGRMIADWICGSRHPRSLAPFSLFRFLVK